MIRSFPKPTDILDNLALYLRSFCLLFQVSMFKLFAISFLIFILVIPNQPLLGLEDYSKQNLIESDFSNRDLKGVTFNLSNFKNANLSGSDFQGASLFGAKLQGANMKDVNLRDATLDSAVFDETDLTNAVLEDAFAFNTHFKNVIINGADFTNVPLRSDERLELCLIAEGRNGVTGRSTYESLECID